MNLFKKRLLKRILAIVLVITTFSTTITIEKAKQYILPLPPLAEQHRIVAKIEETFSIFDGIQNSLEA